MFSHWGTPKFSSFSIARSVVINQRILSFERGEPILDPSVEDEGGRLVIVMHVKVILIPEYTVTKNPHWITKDARTIQHIWDLVRWSSGNRIRLWECPWIFHRKPQDRRRTSARTNCGFPVRGHPKSEQNFMRTHYSSNYWKHTTWSFLRTSITAKPDAKAGSRMSAATSSAVIEGGEDLKAGYASHQRNKAVEWVSEEFPSFRA